MKHSIKITAALMALFLIHQFFALFIVSRNKGSVEAQYGETELSHHAITLPILIITFSLLFILLKKFSIILKYWHLIALTLCTFLTLSSLVGEGVAIILALMIVLLRKKLNNEAMHNLSELFIYPALVLALLPMLNTLSVIVLLIIISIYDVLAVYCSKHMIVLAKTHKIRIFSGIKISSKRHRNNWRGYRVQRFSPAQYSGLWVARSSIINHFLIPAMLSLLMLAGKKSFIQQCHNHWLTIGFL